MDRQESNRSAPLLLCDSLEFPRAQRILVADEADESLDVGAPHCLVVPRESSELADVREAAGAVPAREHGQVVVVLRDDALAELLEPDPRSRAHEAFVPLEEGPKQALVALGEVLRERPLECGEQRTARCVPPDEHERVVRDPDERRCEHRRECDVVVPVVDQPQVSEEIDDLLLAEVAATGRAVRREPFAPQRLFVALGIGACGEQDDDLSGLRLTGVHELADTRGDAPRLACAPVLARAGEGRLVGHEELDRMPEDGVCELRRRGERLVVVAEGVAEEVVDRGEHLGARAVVPRQ